MFVQFGTAGFPGDGLYLGNFHQDSFHFPTDFVRLFERDARHGRCVDRQRTLVERRQEVATQAEEYDKGPNQQHESRSQDEPFVDKHPLQRSAINLFQRSGDDGFFLVAFQNLLSGQQIATQNGGQRDGHYHRGKQRNDKRNAERTQHPSLHTVEEEERNEGNDRDDGCVDDRRTDLFRGFEHDLQDRQTFFGWFGVVLAEPFEYIFDVDDGIIHQRTDGNGHTAEAHRIDRQPQCLEYQNGDKERQRECDQRDDRRAEVHQENEQNDDDEYRPFDQRFLDVVDRALDEPRLAEDVGRDVDVRRKALPDLIERIVEVFGEF